MRSLWVCLLCVCLLTGTTEAFEIVRTAQGGWTMRLLRDGARALIVQPAESAWSGWWVPEAVWVDNQSLQSTGELAWGPAILVDSDPATNLRRRPRGEVIAQLDARQPVFIVQPGEWAQVLTCDGRRGYLHRSVIEPLNLQSDPKLVAELLRPLAALHAARSDRDPHFAYLKVYLGPWGTALLDPEGRLESLKLGLRPGRLTGGFSFDRSWAVVGLKWVGPPDFETDIATDRCLLQRTADGHYREVLTETVFQRADLDRIGLGERERRCLQIPTD